MELCIAPRSCVRSVLLGLLFASFISCARTRGLDEIRYSFSTCDASGRNGPVFMKCMDNYTKDQSPLIRDKVLFGFGPNTYEGAQGFKVPRSGLYNITVAGAAGGIGVCNFEYGRGLVVRLQANLFTEFDLLVLVGQRGVSPCDINPSHELCESPPTTVEQSMECGAQWNDDFTGGAGGGGASMLWQRNATSGEFWDAPFVVAGGGGGSSAILDYDIVELLNLTDCENDSELCYQELLNAKSERRNPELHDPPGFQGFRYPFGNLSGVGGGFSGEPDKLDEQGDSLRDDEEFAKGGFDCIRGTGVYINGEFEEVYGGFGGGGGGCREGGGGGGYTGGDVLFYGNNVPGGGGYSTIYYGEMDIPDGDFSLNDGDGYVEIVPADCGCVYECAVSGEEFECLCPGETQLAPDQSDCYRAVTMNVRPHSTLNLTTSDGIQYLALQFDSNETGNSIFSIDAILKTGTQQKRERHAARQSDGEGVCAICFLGDNSEIVLVSNHIRGSGRTTTLAEVTVDTDGNFTISEYTDFLSSSVLVTGAVLISTGPCSVEGMVITVNASIQEVDAVLNRADLTALFEAFGGNSTSVFATSVLQLDETPEPTESPNPSESQSGIKRVIIIVTVLLSLVILIAIAIMAILIVLYHQYFCSVHVFNKEFVIDENLAYSRPPPPLLLRPLRPESDLEHTYEELPSPKYENEDQWPDPEYENEDQRPVPEYKYKDQRPVPEYENKDQRPGPEYENKDQRPVPKYENEDQRPVPVQTQNTAKVVSILMDALDLPVYVRNDKRRPVPVQAQNTAQGVSILMDALIDPHLPSFRSEGMQMLSKSADQDHTSSAVLTSHSDSDQHNVQFHDKNNNDYLDLVA